MTRPGPGVIRLRIAVTDIEKSKPLLRLIPHTRTLSAGRGGAVCEGEGIDSQTEEQLFAFIRRAEGKRLSTSGLTPMSDIKASVDQWAQRIGDRITEKLKPQG